VKTLIVDKKRMYALAEDSDGALFFEVVVGGIAMEAVEFRLNEEETRRYQLSGTEYLNELAYDVCKDASRFQNQKR